MKVFSHRRVWALAVAGIRSLAANNANAQQPAAVVGEDA
jgi:hypothetical protein